MDFREYEKAHPEAQPLPEYLIKEMAAGREREINEKENAQSVADLKESIKRQLTEGNAPQYVLYAAVKAISLLTHDPEWLEYCRVQLDSVYSDLVQQSFIVDNDAIAAERLEEMKTAYNTKLRKQLVKDLRGYRQIEKSINDILRNLTEMEPQETILKW